MPMALTSRTTGRNYVTDNSILLFEFTKCASNWIPLNCCRYFPHPYVSSHFERGQKMEERKFIGGSNCNFHLFQGKNMGE